MDKEELLVIEPIIGYKFLSKINFELSSVIESNIWIKGINIAKCYKCEDVPEFNCCCGFHTYKDIEEINKYFNLINIVTNSFTFVELQLTGKVIEHRIGYRSEKAEIKKIIFDDMPDRKQFFEFDDFKPVSDCYEVPLIKCSDYLEMIKIRELLK